MSCSGQDGAGLSACVLACQMIHLYRFCAAAGQVSEEAYVSAVLIELVLKAHFFSPLLADADTMSERVFFCVTLDLAKD